ncbi:hypothetical protein GCM10027517_29000 [Phycicoccus ginsengisoli]
MEYLNPNPSPALPQAMWLVYRAAMERPGTRTEDLFDLVVPTAIRAKTPGAGAHFKSALSALRKLGVLSQHEGVLEATKVPDSRAFLRLLRHRIVQPAASFSADFEGADDIRRGLIWLMRQSPAKPLDYEADVAPKTSVFVNGTRWNTFRTWCDALGFGQAALSVMAKNNANNCIVPNPTRAVVDAIAHPFGEGLPRGEQVPIGRLVDFLRRELPVLPGHPSAMLEGLNEDEDNALRAIGLALTAAEELDVLTLKYQSDPSGVMALPDAQHGETRYVSAVTIGK